MPRYFQKISKDTIALLFIVKKILTLLTIGGALATAGLNLNPYVLLVIVLVREGLGEFIQIAKTGKMGNNLD